MHTLSIDSKAVSIFQTGISGVPVIYLNTYSEEGQQVFEAAQAAGYPPFTLVAISDLDWNHPRPRQRPSGIEPAECR